MAKQGRFYPTKKDDSSCGWRAEGDFFEVSGFLLTELHPVKAAVSDTALDFEYSVGGSAVTRSYGLVKSGGKISSVTFPDGHVMEVVRS